MESTPLKSPKTTNSTMSGRKSNKKFSFKRIYVWELPIRIFHWVNALAIILLMITGLYIGKPIFSPTVPEEAYFSNVMGWARYIHFFAAFVFTANLLYRVYWFFKGNIYAKSNPLKISFWKDVFETTKFYLFLPNKKKHTPGHNSLAQLSYWIFIGIGSVIMILTGIFLYFEPQFESVAIAKIGALFGGDSFTVRSFHHIVAWFFMIFMVVHIYMAFRDDWLNRNGTMSSIFTGYKYEKVEEDEEDDKLKGEASEKRKAN